jgi:hypothetical protein
MFSVPVFFKERSAEKWISNGSEINLRCDVSGDPPIDITWERNGSIISKMLASNR